MSKYPWPWAPLPLWLLEAELHPVAKLLYARLLYAGNSDGIVFQTNAVMMKWVRIRSRRYLWKVLEELQRAGLLHWTRSRYGNKYQVIVEESVILRCAPNSASQMRSVEHTDALYRAHRCAPESASDLNKERARGFRTISKTTPKEGGGPPFASETWTAYWSLFVDSGKPLNPQDQSKALAVWSTLSEADQSKALADARGGFANGRWRSPDYTPRPANHLADQPWTRTAAPRKEPESIYGPPIRRRKAAAAEA